MSFVKEFKEFAIKGNVIDLAIAVVMGAAFAAIVSSLVDDVITPLILTPALNAIGAKDLNQLVWNNVKYGNFIAAVIKFIIIALVLFLVIKGINRFKKKEPAVTADPSSTDILLMEIRDSLNRRNIP